MPSCGGCRTCEMVFSFKHQGAFVPSISSIKILDKEREPGFEVVLIEENDGMSLPCDGCNDLPEPICLQYCNKSEDLEEILKEFLEKIGFGKRKAKGDSSP